VKSLLWFFGLFFSVFLPVFRFMVFSARRIFCLILCFFLHRIRLPGIPVISLAGPLWALCRLPQASLSDFFMVFFGHCDLKGGSGLLRVLPGFRGSRPGFMDI